MAIPIIAGNKWVYGFGEIVAAIFLLMGICGALLAHLSMSWPGTKGKIIASIVGFTSRSGERLYLAYEYSVDGISYVRSRINGGIDLGWSSSIAGLSSAAQSVRDYPLDAEVAVYYCPKFPGVCCLKKGGFAGSIFLLISGFLLFLICRHFDA